MCSAVARTLVGHGILWSNGWRQVSELKWRDGEAIPLSDYTTGGSDFMSVYSLWWQWTYPAAEILLRVDEGSTHWTYQKAPRRSGRQSDQRELAGLP